MFEVERLVKRDRVPNKFMLCLLSFGVNCNMGNQRNMALACKRRRRRTAQGLRRIIWEESLRL